MYFVIDYLTNPLVPDPEEGPFLEINEEDIYLPGSPAWQTGDRIETELPNPIEIEATAHHGYKGPPHDFFDGSIAFVSPRMLNCLKQSGVNNFDSYPVVITYRGSSEKHNVFAINILGLVAAVDEAGSNLKSADGDFRMDTSIEGFAVDPEKAHDLSLFRLAENCMTVLVHERLKEKIEAAGIKTFAFVKPEDWTQL
jgi:hypothetical protein